MHKMISFNSAVAFSLIACGGGNNTTVVDAKGSGSGSGMMAACKDTSVAASYAPTFTDGNTEIGQYFPAMGSGSSAEPITIQWEGVLGGTIGSSSEIDLVLDVSIGGSNFPTYAPKANVSLGDDDIFSAIFTDYDTKGNPGIIYLPTAGTLSVTAIGSAGSAFTGTWNNVAMEHADIGSNGATPDPDACMSTIATASFSAIIQPPGSGGFQDIVGERPDYSGLIHSLRNRFH
jgi:hypothetical protein